MTQSKRLRRRNMVKTITNEVVMVSLADDNLQGSSSVCWRRWSSRHFEETNSTGRFWEESSKLQMFVSWVACACEEQLRGNHHQPNSLLRPCLSASATHLNSSTGLINYSTTAPKESSMCIFFLCRVSQIYKMVAIWRPLSVHLLVQCKSCRVAGGCWEISMLY